MQHYAIRTQRYRYILYNSGQEEIYDHKKDPYEWYNLAGKKKRILGQLRRELMERLEPHILAGFTKIEEK